MPVGGSRHYVGGGLGSESGWRCPACGGENAGPIAQGCALCGSGRPGRHVDEPPPLPPAAEPEEPDPVSPPGFERWRQQHPGATLEDAFTAGYLLGVREAIGKERAQLEGVRPPIERPFNPEHKITRTIIAALDHFRAWVLTGAQEEILNGEWCSVEEVTHLITQLQAQLHQGESVHG
jgi:hypothetical protein